MPEEHESAFAAWLDLPETKREMDIISQRIYRETSRHPTMFERIQIALQMEILVSLNMYADPLPTTDGPLDDEDDEPWDRPEGWNPSEN